MSRYAVELLTPQEWWQQGIDRPAQSMYAVISRTETYSHPRHCPNAVPLIAYREPLASYLTAEIVCDHMNWNAD